MNQSTIVPLQDFIDILDKVDDDRLKFLRNDVLANVHAIRVTDSEISGSFNGGKRYEHGQHCLYVNTDSCGNEVYLISTPLGPVTVSVDFNRKDPSKQKISVRAYDRSITEIIMEVRDSEEMDRGGIKNISQLKEVLELTLEQE